MDDENRATRKKNFSQIQSSDQDCCWSPLNRATPGGFADGRPREALVSDKKHALGSRKENMNENSRNDSVLYVTGILSYICREQGPVWEIGRSGERPVISMDVRDESQKPPGPKVSLSCPMHTVPQPRPRGLWGLPRDAASGSEQDALFGFPLGLWTVVIARHLSRKWVCEVTFSFYGSAIWNNGRRGSRATRIGGAVTYFEGTYPSCGLSENHHVLVRTNNTSFLVHSFEISRGCLHAEHRP